MRKASEQSDCEVAVVGGGPAGLAAALGLARQGFETVLLAPPEQADDGRTAALLQGSVEFLDRLGVWTALEAQAEALRVMEIVDDTGRLFRASTARFEAAEIGLAAFGYNIPNAAIVATLAGAVRRELRLRWIPGPVLRAVPEEDRVKLTAGDVSISATSVVAADGHNSLIRRSVGIEADTWSYPQTALVVNIEHARPHRGVSTELHRTVGPFTLVPLPGNHSSLVWVEAPAVAEQLHELDDESLAAEIEHRSHGIRGRVRIASRRWLYPLHGLLARRLASGPVALVGEAAHVFPPIAAQGLNLGLRDVATLCELLGDARREGTDPRATLSVYDRRRRSDVFSRTAGVHVLNRSLLGNFLPLQLGRAAALGLITHIAPLRRALMRQGVRPGF